MEWEAVTATAGLVASLIAIITVIWRSATISVKLDVLWQLYLDDARTSAGKGGNMRRGSGYVLTNEGLDKIPSKLKEQLKAHIARSKSNNIGPWEIVKVLGGYKVLAGYAAESDLTLSQLLVMIEAFIEHRGLTEA